MSHAEENCHHTSQKSAQVAVVKKVAALKAEAEERTAPVRKARLAASAAPLAEATVAADVLSDRHESQDVNAGRAPVRLLDKSDILSITHVTFPTIWTWMRAGTFPRSRVVGGKSMWLSSEIDAWLADLPMRALKGDAEVELKQFANQPATEAV